MSYQLMAWAAGQRTGSVTRKAVLLAITNAANHHSGLCRPSVSRIAEETELSERAVRQALKDLVEQGLIERQRPRRADGSLGTYRYSFPHVERGAQPAAAAAAREASKPAAPAAALEPGTTTTSNQEVLSDDENGKNSRPRNLLWDALTAVFGEATTETARSRRGKVCRSLARAGASSDEIVQRAKAWPRHFEDATLTETALEKHWDALGRPPLRLARR